MLAKKGDWVRIHKIILESNQRAENIPEDTKKIPLEMWDKGFLIDEEAKIGDFVEVETYIGRRTQGELIEINPYYDHDYGKSVPEILYIGRQAKALLKEGDDDER